MLFHNIEISLTNNQEFIMSNTNQDLELFRSNTNLDIKLFRSLENKLQ